MRRTKRRIDAARRITRSLGHRRSHTEANVIWLLRSICCKLASASASPARKATSSVPVPFSKERFQSFRGQSPASGMVIRRRPPFVSPEVMRPYDQAPCPTPSFYRLDTHGIFAVGQQRTSTQTMLRNRYSVALERGTCGGQGYESWKRRSPFSGTVSWHRHRAPSRHHGVASRPGARLPVGSHADLRDDRSLHDRGSL